jgi:ketosteroid isomerase-like protein
MRFPTRSMAAAMVVSLPIALAALAPAADRTAEGAGRLVMTSAGPIQEPVTGREELGDLSEPAQALAQFYRAVNTRDIDLLADNWDHSAQAAMDNPLGGIKRGWPEIRSVYERIFAGDSKFHFEFHDYTLHVSDSVFYAVGRERGRFEKGGKSMDLAIRTSRVFHRIDGRWRQVHHHGSIERPEMLDAYQKLVK